MKKPRMCSGCDHCVYIGEGDYICDRAQPFICMEDHCPNEFYGACNDPVTWKLAQECVDDNELSDTQQKTTKEVEAMIEQEKTREYIFSQMQKCKDNIGILREFLGTAICDSGCPKFNDECIRVCPVAVALENFESDPTADNWNKLKSIVGSKVHEIYERR